MYEFVLVYKEDGELFEDIVVRIINNKIKAELELDFSNMNEIKLIEE